jgi:RimJ/RimL family protein N-acetyltransferase
MHVLQTDRLILRRYTLDDAEFIVRLVNDPSWLRFIGDKNVHNLDDARRYLREGPLDMYERYGFGMFRVEERDGGTPAGMCGLIKRDTLPDVDVGYARPRRQSSSTATACSGCSASSQSLHSTTPARSACWKKPA